MRGAKPSLNNVVPMKGDAVRRAPDAPAHLGVEGREIWERLAPILINKGRLEPEYEESFMGFCFMAGQAQRLYAKIAEEGTEYEVETRNGKQQKHSPSWIQVQQAIAHMNQISARFGLSPVDDARLKGGAQGDLFKDLLGALDGAD